MKTRTLLLLSVGVGLLILLAGGVFLVQLSNESAAVEPSVLGEPVEVGDADVTVLGADDVDGMLTVSVELGGVDDADGVGSFRLVTGDQRIEPELAAAEGRCIELTVEAQRCRVEFDVGTAESSSRVLVMRRGDDQHNWVLPAP